MSPRFAPNNDDSMRQTSQSRRRFPLGMGALTAALAGCSSDDDQEATDNSDDDTPTDETPAEDTPADDTPAEDTPADDTPTEDTPTDDPSTDTFDPASELPYSHWLTTDQNGLFFAYANLDNYPDEAVGGSNGSSDPAVDDPLALYPLVIGGGAVGVGQLALSLAGLGQAIRPTGTSDSRANEVTVTNETIIAEGSFATDQLDD
jgi:hypothetical protein